MEVSEALDATLGVALNLSRTAERLRAALLSLKPAIEAVGGVAEAEPALRPELTAALTALDEAGEALARAMKYAEANFDEQLARIRQRLAR